MNNNNYKITDDKGNQHNVPIINVRDKDNVILDALERLKGALAMTVHARHDLILGQKDGIKKTMPLLDGDGDPIEGVQGEKLFGYNMLVNVNYETCVRNALRREGDALIEAKEMELGEFLLKEADKFQVGSTWGTHKAGQRHVIEHTDKKGIYKNYVMGLTWIKRGSLYHQWLDTKGNKIPYNDIKPHLYASSNESPYVKLSNGDKFNVPFHTRRIDLKKIAHVVGLDYVPEEQKELNQLATLETK